MASIDTALVRRRARWAYESSRLGRATLAMAPVLLVVAGASAASHRPTSALAFGFAAVVCGTVLLWWGQGPQRAVLPGTLAGLVPLVASLVANGWHGCHDHGCSTLCVQACTAGGLVAGLGVAAWGHLRRGGPDYWLPAAGMAVLTGSMGCACVGFAGVAGLAGGLAVGLLPLPLGRAVLRSR